jgi:tetratricopeptide (TPR) repeat protein
MKWLLRRPALAPTLRSVRQATVSPAEAVLAKAVEALPIGLVPLNADLLKANLLSSLRKGRVDEDARRLVTAHLEAPISDQKTIIMALLTIILPKRVAELLSLFTEADQDAGLHIKIAHRALECGDVATARESLRKAKHLVGEHRTVELEIAEATLASMVEDVAAATTAISKILHHPDAKFKDLLSGLSLADGTCRELIPQFLQKMQAIAHGAHRLTVARQIYEFGEDPNTGMKAMAALLHDQKLAENAAYWIARYLRHAGYLPEASAMFTALTKKSAHNPKPYLDLAEIAIEDGDYRGALKLVAKALTLAPADKPLFSPAEFTAYASMGKFSSAWSLYKKRATHQQMQQGYLQDRYHSNFDKWLVSDNRMLVAVSGLGDEIRWSSGYSHLSDNKGEQVITCDPRLHPLFVRSFPSLQFLPVKRRYKVVNRVAGPNYDNVPTAELTYFFDNSGWDAALRADRVTTMYDAVASLLPTREAFGQKTPLLIADPQKVKQWAARLPADDLPKIGLSWRSDLLSYARTQHYTEIDSILDLVRSRRAHWYILQSELSDQERQSVLDAAGGNAVFAKDICDIKSDLDDTAAFLKCLDVIVAPATANLELAGAVGTPAILMSRSRHVSWRILEDSRDIWFSNVVHAQVPLSLDLNGRRLIGVVREKIAAIVGGETANG